jgi:hypothetical protein
MKFEYFRFLLTPVKDPQLPFHDALSKEDIIKDIFAKGRTYHFNSKRARFGMTVDFFQNNLVYARIGKQTTKKLRSSPDEGFVTKDAEDWPGSYLFINLSDEIITGKTHENGQVVAFSLNKIAIQNPKNCLRALAKKINEDLTHKGFYLTINPIPTERKKFWTAAKEYEGKICKVILTYTAPNLFKIGSSLEDDLKEINKNFNTTSSQIVLENDGGNIELPEDNKLLQETAKYIDLGGGSYKFHLNKGKKTVISSEDGIRTETFDGLELTLEGSVGDKIENVLKQVLGIKND